MEVKDSLARRVAVLGISERAAISKSDGVTAEDTRTGAAQMSILSSSVSGNDWGALVRCSHAPLEGRTDCADWATHRSAR